MPKLTLFFQSLFLLLLLADVKGTAQFRDLSLSGFPLELLADFRNVTGFKTIEFRELYVHAGDTLIPKQLVRRYTYDNASIKQRYEKRIYAEGYKLHNYYNEETSTVFSPDSFCISTTATYYKPKDGVRTSGTKRCRYSNSSGSGHEEFFYNNGLPYAQNQKRTVLLNDSTYKMTHKEWRNNSLVSQKDTLLIRGRRHSVVDNETEPATKTRDNAPYLQYDYPINRPFRYVITTRHGYYTEEEIYKFIYHGNDTLAYRVEYYKESGYGSERGYGNEEPEHYVTTTKPEKKGPEAVILLENYAGRIPTRVTYLAKNQNDKRIVWITLKK